MNFIICFTTALVAFFVTTSAGQNVMKELDERGFGSGTGVAPLGNYMRHQRPLHFAPPPFLGVGGASVGPGYMTNFNRNFQNNGMQRPQPGWIDTILTFVGSAVRKLLLINLKIAKFVLPNRIFYQVMPQELQAMLQNDAIQQQQRQF